MIIAEFSKSINIKDAVLLSAKCWGEIEPGTMAKSWNKLLMSGSSQQEEEETPEVDTLLDIQHTERRWIGFKLRTVMLDTTI